MVWKERGEHCRTTIGHKWHRPKVRKCEKTIHSALIGYCLNCGKLLYGRYQVEVTDEQCTSG